MEPIFCEMYANFCSHLAYQLPGLSVDNEKITFKRLLLNKCQEEFERGEREQEEANKVDEAEGEVKLSNEEREQIRTKARRRMLGNIGLIGELYKKKMLTESIMHGCIKKLVGQCLDPDEEDVEALCKLMSIIGEMIDHPKAKEHMDVYFGMLKILSNNMNLSSRVRFMLKDLIDLRRNRWQVRRKVDGPEKIEKVHRDAVQERQAQAQAGRMGCGMGNNQSARRNPMLRNDDRNLNRPVATSPHAQSQGPIVSQNASTDERLRDMSLSAIREYYSARDVNEVAQCIKDLNSPNFHPSMVSLWVTDSFERKDAERDLLAKLLVKLGKSQDGLLSQTQLIEGFEIVLSTLEDAVNDAPKAPDFLGRIFAELVTESLVGLNEIGQLVHDGGEEPGSLLEFGLAADVLGSTLEAIKREKGDVVLSEIRTSSTLRLESFRPPNNSTTSRKLEQFI